MGTILQVQHKTIAKLIHPRSPVNWPLADQKTRSGKTLGNARQDEQYNVDPRANTAMFPKDSGCDNVCPAVARTMATMRKAVQAYKYLQETMLTLAQTASNVAFGFLGGR